MLLYVKICRVIIEIGGHWGNHLIFDMRYELEGEKEHHQIYTHLPNGMPGREGGVRSALLLTADSLLAGDTATSGVRTGGGVSSPSV